MFNAYIERFQSEICDVFRIAPQRSDSEETKRQKEDIFKSIVCKLRDIMEKRHYVSIVYTVAFPRAAIYRHYVRIMIKKQRRNSFTTKTGLPANIRF